MTCLCKGALFSSEILPNFGLFSVMFLFHKFLNYTNVFHLKGKKMPVTYQKPAATLISARGTGLAPAHITLCLRIMLMNAKTG